jgi:hypothetical protein
MMRYLHDCVSCPPEDVDELINLVDYSKKISRRVFMYRVDRQALEDHAESLGYALHYKQGMTMAADRHITYHRGRFKGKQCYYFVWSGMEHLFVEE